MALRPWYNIVALREDLREGRSLDASEFAVHLDQIRDARAPDDYRDPARFFDRTFLTVTLTELAAGVVRRLSGIRVATSPVYNLTTQFGGGKTHALSMLYHLATGGPAAASWKGVPAILAAADVTRVPLAAVAVFVGLEFDSLKGRGGEGGQPLRRTPWGEIAWQLGGAEGYAAVARHDEERVAPSSEVIRKFLPKGRPALILLDELMNYVSRNRQTGLGAQLYNFLQNLSEEVRGQDSVVLAVSLPASELEMSADDHADYDRLNKLLQRLGKALLLSSGDETSEIIRRRLFEWHGMPQDAKATAAAYAEWMVHNRRLLPAGFPVDTAVEAIRASYPFHPAVLSVFERKWQTLPQFQQTRGVLRMLALWISNAARVDYQAAHKDPLITLGTAPLGDPLFRQAVFGQLGDGKLEGVVTTDIAGKNDAHALRLDKEANDAIRKARLHQKVATVIFFESNGGQAKAEATLPEVRFAVAEPNLDIGNVETVLDSLMSTCYFLSAEKNRYRFSRRTNLNRLVADRRAAVSSAKIEARAREEVLKVFSETPKGAKAGAVKPLFFPERSVDIADRAALTLVVLAPDFGLSDKEVTAFVETATRECGSSGRTFKSALFWAAPDGPDALREGARKLLAWEEIEAEVHDLKLDEGQKRQLAESRRAAERDLKEAVWRVYRFLLFLGKDGALKTVDLGQLNSSQSDTLLSLLLGRLSQDGELTDGVSPGVIVRSWSGAYKEWSTRSVREAFYASPQLPRILSPDALKDTIAKGVSGGQFAYVGKAEDGSYEPFHWQGGLTPGDVEFSDDMFLIKREDAEAYKARRSAPAPEAARPASGPLPTDLGAARAPVAAAPPEPPSTPPPPRNLTRLSWSGTIPPQKWMNFYTKVLSRFATVPALKLTLRVEVTPPDGISSQAAEDMRVALRELGLDDRLDIE